MLNKLVKAKPKVWVSRGQIEFGVFPFLTLCPFSGWLSTSTMKWEDFLINVFCCCSIFLLFFFFQSAGGCPAQLGSPGAFLSPELPPVPSPSTSPNNFGPDRKQKPLLPYTLPNKWLSLDHYGSYCPAPLSRAPLLGQQPVCPPLSAPCSKFHYPSAPLFSCPNSPSLSTACFSPNIPGYNIDLPSGYHSPFSASHLLPSLPSSPISGMARGQPPSGSDRPKAKGATIKNKRSPRLPVPPLAATISDQCLTELLTIGRSTRQNIS